jgi:hypothetical protein
MASATATKRPSRATRAADKATTSSTTLTRPSKVANVPTPQASGSEPHKYWTEKQMESCATKINSIFQRNAVGFIQVGAHLAEAHENIDPGTWGVWVRKNLRYERRATEQFIAIASHPVLARVLVKDDPVGKQVAAALPSSWTSLYKLAQIGFERAEKVGGRSFRLYKDDGKALLALITEGRVYPHMERADCQALADDYAGKPEKEPKPVTVGTAQTEGTPCGGDEIVDAEVVEPKALPAGTTVSVGGLDTRTDAQRFVVNDVVPLLQQIETFGDLIEALEVALNAAKAKADA